MIPTTPTPEKSWKNAVCILTIMENTAVLTGVKPSRQNFINSILIDFLIDSAGPGLSRKAIVSAFSIHMQLWSFLGYSRFFHSLISKSLNSYETLKISTAEIKNSILKYKIKLNSTQLQKTNNNFPYISSD